MINLNCLLFLRPSLEFCARESKSWNGDFCAVFTCKVQTHSCIMSSSICYNNWSLIWALLRAKIGSPLDRNYFQSCNFKNSLKEKFQRERKNMDFAKSKIKWTSFLVNWTWYFIIIMVEHNIRFFHRITRDFQWLKHTWNLCENCAQFLISNGAHTQTKARKPTWNSQ